MPDYSYQVTLPHARDSVFDLVLDIERYPEFVPGWREVRVLERGQHWLRVEQRIGTGLIRLRFVSLASFERPHRIGIESARFPFRHLQIDWRFTSVPDGCLVELDASLALVAMNRLVDPLAAQFGAGMLDSFRRRAARALQPLAADE